MLKTRNLTKHASDSDLASAVPPQGLASLSLPTLLLSIAGFGTSLYTLIEHLRLTAGKTQLGCDINEKLNCSSVLSSEYAEFLHIPVGAFGMAYFGAMIAMAIVPKLTEVSKSWIGQWRLIFNAIGMVTSIYFIYISSVKIGAFCPWCMATHAINLLLLIYHGFDFIKNKETPKFAHPSAFVKLFATSLALSVPALLAGAILPTAYPAIAAAMGKKIEPSKSESPATNTPATPAAPVNLSFSKSNFVGAGEDFRKGNDEAKVVVQLFSDFECPHCKVSTKAMESAVTNVGAENVVFVYRNYPLSKCDAEIEKTFHPYACSLALAARCAGQQGKFWEFKDWAFEGQTLSDGEKAKTYSLENMKSQAKSMGLNDEQFGSCMTSKVELPKILDDIKTGDTLGIRATPTIFINNVKYEGSPTPQAFAEEIKRAMNR
jgi:uncharacterized membrane protein/protein-disulfide isomerase